jgi:hypothetical protein
LTVWWLNVNDLWHNWLRGCWPLSAVNRQVLRRLQQ